MAEIPTPTTGYSSPSKNRPLGITILSILLILGAISNLISAPFSIGIYGILYGSYTVIMGLVNLFIGYGLFKLLPWSRTAAIIIEGIGIIAAVLLGYVLFGTLGLMIMLPASIIPIIIILYLMQGSIKASFESGQW